MINPMDLTGKKILLTGASSGIGRETAIVLSQLGAKVVLMARNERALQETLNLMVNPEKHQVVILDLAQTDEIEPVIKTLVTDEPFHGFVHCAGIAPMRPLAMCKKVNIEQVMNINFYSFVEIVRVLTKGKKGFISGGSIVVMSSTASIHGKPTKVAYSASKAAIDAAVKCMTVELKEKKIRINSVMPSWVNTIKFSSFIQDYSYSKDMQEIAEKQYLGITEPYEVANLIAFLLSDATKTITGASILMDGGILQG